MPPILDALEDLKCTPEIWPSWDDPRNPFIALEPLMRAPADTPRGPRLSAAGGCAAVAYKMHCEDMARIAWSVSREVRAAALSSEAARLGGWS